MAEVNPTPLRLSKRVQARLDFALPYVQAEVPAVKPLPYPPPTLFDAPPPLTGGYDSYDKWKLKKKQTLHHLVEIRNGFANSKGSVFDSEGRRVELASHKSKLNASYLGLKRNALTSVRPFGPKKTFTSRSDVIVVTSSTSQMYYHGMLEIVPRLHIAQKLGLCDRLPLYIDASQPFMRECLKALKLENIIDASKYPRIHAPNLIVPSYEISGFNSIPKWSVDLLHKLFPTSNSVEVKPKRKLYLSRRNANRRKLKNEDDVFAALLELGFEMVFPEDLSIQEQADLFRQASVVAGPSGGAFTNIVFCRPGTVVLNFFHWKADNSLFKLADACQLHYAYVATKPKTHESLFTAFRQIEIGSRDVFIDLADLRRTFTLVHDFVERQHVS
jgi:hypothetical protein